MKKSQMKVLGMVEPRSVSVSGSCIRNVIPDLTVSENSGTDMPSPPRPIRGMMAMEAKVADAAPVIEAEKIELSTTVQVRLGLK